MPAPDFCSINSLPGADCTHTPTSTNKLVFDPTSWFTDLDIVSILTNIIPRPKFDFLNPLFVNSIIKNESSMGLNLASKFKDAQMIFIPVNILDCHWVLFVFYRTTKQDFWMDPYPGGFKLPVARKYCKDLHRAINKILNTNHRFIQDPLSNVRTQTNNYDCGPLTCFYALQLINDRDLNDQTISMLHLRELAFKIQSDVPDSNLIDRLLGGGSSELENYQSKSSINSPRQINEVLRLFFQDCTEIHILNPELVQTLLDNDRQSIMENVRFRTFKDIKFIATTLLIDDEIHLFIYELVEKSSYIFHLDNKYLSDISISNAQRITRYLNIFCLDGQVTLASLPNSFIRMPLLTHPSEKSVMVCCQHFGQLSSNIPKFNPDITNILQAKSNRLSRDATRLINSRMSHESIISFFDTLKLDSSFTILDPIMSTALLDENWTYLTSFLDVSQIKQAKYVFCLVQPSGFHVCLLIVDFQCWEFYIVNPSSTIIVDDLRILCTTIVSKLTEFICVDMANFCLNSCPYRTNGSGLFSNLLICGYIENFAKDLPLTDIDTDHIALKFEHNLKPVNFENQIVQYQLPKSSSGSNIKERIEKCNSITESCTNLNPNEINEILINNIPVLSKPKSKSYRPYLGTKKPFQLPDRIKLRQLFKEKMKQTVDRITFPSETIRESPSTENICQAFQLPASLINNWPILTFCTRVEETLELTPIDFEEVISKLKSLKNCAPGPDRINYGHLKQFDPEGKFLCNLFNKIIEQGSSPDSWRCFQTTLIPKPGKNSYSDVSSWRPIALANSSYKLFTSILADRLNQWVTRHRILHPGQKGGSEFEGCIEHNAVLTAIFEQAKSGHRHSEPALIAWLDIKSAFPSVPHQYLWTNLRAIGVGETFIHTLQELYTGNSTFYKCGQTITPEIPVNVGVKQGCPISMLLFALAINPVLLSIEASNIEKYDILGHKIQILAYADDIAIIANNHKDLQALLDITTANAKQCNLIFQPNKCAYLSVPYDNIDSSSIHVDTTFIKKLLPGQFYEYLGVPIGDHIDQSPHELIDEIIRSAERINSSELMKHQKIKAIKTFLFPKLTFTFRTREIKRSTLEADSKNRSGTSKDNPSTKLRSIFKKMLSLPPQAENSYLYVSTNNGGVGLWDLYDEYNLQQLVQAFKLLNSPDYTISDLIRNSLTKASSTRLKVPDPSIAQALDWINGNSKPVLNSISRKTWWIRVRHAVSFFRASHSTVINFEQVDDFISLRITDARQITTVAGVDDLKKITMILHEAVHFAYLIKWSKSKNSYLMCQSLSHNPKLNKLILSGQIGTFAWDFIHRAKINCLQINAKPMTLDPAKRQCRRCHTEEETMTHALQICKPNMSIITMRHDACLDIIYSAIRSSNLIININETIPFLSSDNDVCRQRIDIYIEDVCAKRIFLIDLKCPIDFLDTMAKAEFNNLKHYENLKHKVAQYKPSYMVDLDTLIVGALGSIPDSSLAILKKIGITEKSIPFIANQLSITSIRHSARIWHLHCSGILIGFVGHQKDLAAESCPS